MSRLPGFRATGLGYYNQVPNFVADANNANGLFINEGLPPGNQFNNIHVFVTDISSSWAINGTTGQSPSYRVFYPTNLSQSEVTIQGLVANQHEFDRLAEFFIKHHETAVGNSSSATSGVQTKALEFHMKPYKVEAGYDSNGNLTYRYIHRGLPGGGNGVKVQGYALSWQAGARRFQNAPTWQLQLRVSYDFISDPIHLEDMSVRQLMDNYEATFGTPYRGSKTKKLNLPQSNFNDSGFIENNAAWMANDPHLFE